MPQKRLHKPQEMFRENMITIGTTKVPFRYHTQSSQFHLY